MYVHKSYLHPKPSQVMLNKHHRHTRMCVCVHVRIYVCVCVRVHIHEYVCMYVYVSVCACVYTYISMYACMCVRLIHETTNSTCRL